MRTAETLDGAMESLVVGTGDFANLFQKEDL
jgi:hypothetical protein